MAPALTINFSLAMFKTLNGMIQLLIWLFSFAGFVALAAWDCTRFGRTVDYTDIDGGHFLMAMLVIAWLIGTIVIIIYALFSHMLESLPVSWWLLITSYSASWFFMTIIASSVFASEISDSDDADALEQADCGTGALDFATVMGFFNSFALLAAAVLGFLTFKNSSSQKGNMASAEPAAATDVPTAMHV
eukprot:TRINITY_DN6478_c0_g1_i1.p1 TRINITY_DN6478_c0_g1~~TRINITY_DN6478_c0_g1_i1.p1  ORF type:complete len:198 (+),score=35.26 TRINITY_DN6478_c0_g1_i1:28-594(+)